MSRNYREARCRSCREWLWLGLDEDLAAFEARVVPQPVSVAAEAVGRLLGLQSYLARSRKLYVREWWHIKAGEPQAGGTIHLEHRCGQIPFGIQESPMKETQIPEEMECPY